MALGLDNEGSVWDYSLMGQTPHTTNYQEDHMTSSDFHLGQSFHSEGMGLTVFNLNYGREASVEDINSGQAVPVEAIASQDSRGVIAEWHTGPEAEWVYYERYDSNGRTSHGWVDSDSRRIVQAG